MTVTCLKAHFKKLPLKKIVYEDYKNFNKNTFLYDLDQNLIQGKFYSQKNSYDLFTFVCGNNAPFMTKHLRKAVMTRSRRKRSKRKQIFKISLKRKLLSYEKYEK